MFILVKCTPYIRSVEGLYAIQNVADSLLNARNPLTGAILQAEKCHAGSRRRRETSSD